MINVQDLNVDVDDTAKKEHKLLSYLHNNSELASQRKISSGTGISLASVNILLKRMIKRGLVKIERLNRRNLRYILTPSGMAFMSRLTYHYITHSYRLINRLMELVQQLVRETGQNPGTGEVILIGSEDYLYELLTQALEREKAPFCFYDEAGSLPPDIDNRLIIVWDYQVEQALKGLPCRVVNILLFI